MSTPVGSSQWMYTPASGFYPYLIDQSLRFNDGDSPRLSLDPIGSPTLGTKCTISFWFKRGQLTTTQYVFTGEQSNLYYDVIYLTNADKLAIVGQENASSYGYQTTAVFRDVGAFYHCILECDSTLATGTDRYKLYVNGVQQTLTSLYGVHPQNHVWYWNKSGNSQNVGRSENYGNSFDGYMAEVHFVDGTSLDPTSFGETINNIWVPKNVSGLTYGTNGFYLSFADSSAIGDDLSGNTNDFTANNLAASDVVPDSPTNNFATINNIYRGSNTNTAAYGLTSEGNLKFSYSSNSDAGTLCTHPFSSGKYYWELRIVAGGGSSAYQHGTGIANVGAGYRKITNTMDGRDPNEIGMNSYTGQIRQGSTTVVNTLSTTNMANGSIIGCAVDADNGAIYWSYNGTFMNSSDPTSGASKTNAHATWTPSNQDMWVPTINASGGSVPVNVINFGQDSTFGAISAGGNSDENGYGDFAYAPPSGFLAMCSANLPEPAIGPNSTTTSDQHFDTVLFNGTGANQTISGFNFQPDFVWNKTRNEARHHSLNDSVRGGGHLKSSNTDPEGASTISAYNSDGYDWTYNAGNNWYTGSATVVSWAWKAGGTAVSNTDGSITSSVSANPDAGFSIVTWVGNNTDGATVGHGLTDPEFSIVKNRDSGTDWDVCWSGFTSGTSLNLNTTATEFSPTTGYQQLGTSTITLKNGGVGIGRVNGTPDDYVAYVFKSVEGFSKVGSYVGNGSADGAYVALNFKPSFLLVKPTTVADVWRIYDNKRNGNNPDTKFIYPNLTNTEAGAQGSLDFLSNGFKSRVTDPAINGSGQSYIYLAFAEAPFKYANAR